MENRGKRQSASIFGGMGFYIALLVCVLAAGVVGYYALLSDASTTADPHEMDDSIQVVDQMDPGETTPVSAADEPPAQQVMGDEPLVIPGPVEEVHQIREEEPQVDSTEEVSAEPTQQVQGSRPMTVVSPVMGETVAVFALEQLTYDATLGDWRTHDGVDIRAAAGTAVSAAAAGTVRSVEEDGRLGVTVVIDHNNGYVTTYASLHPEVSVMAGDSVSAGTVIGAVGNTSLAEAGVGAHLHFSVSRDGEMVDPEVFLG